MQANPPQSPTSLVLFSRLHATTTRCIQGTQDEGTQDEGTQDEGTQDEGTQDALLAGRPFALVQHPHSVQLLLRSNLDLGGR